MQTKFTAEQVKHISEPKTMTVRCKSANILFRSVSNTNIAFSKLITHKGIRLKFSNCYLMSVLVGREKLTNPNRIHSIRFEKQQLYWKQTLTGRIVVAVS